MKDDISAREMIELLQNVEEKQIAVVFKDNKGRLHRITGFRTGTIGFLEGGVILSSK